MRRTKDPKDPQDKAPDAEQSPPGGNARRRVDLFNRQRGIDDGKQEDTEDATKPPSGKKPEN